MSRLRPLLLAAAVLLTGISAAAQPQPLPVKRTGDAPGPSWTSLSAEQRAILAPLQNDWPSIDGPRKAKWLELAARYPKMPPDDQQRLQARMTEWARLSPQERAQARANFQQVKQLPQQERHDQWEAYRALPESERKALASRAATKGTEPAGKPTPEPSSKRNIVANPSLSAPPVKPVAPTVVQAAPGATTTLVTRQPAPPAHQQAGLPKIAATPGMVDRNTLLPQRGTQSAGVRSPASAPANHQ
ncbi:MAG TPA: DUF3106 domain-containing protein [Burkholderiaceae bacterium]|nr:DUF3106 domain-containing protein [Burkholderiaceae bacterium]